MGDRRSAVYNGPKFGGKVKTAAGLGYRLDLADLTFYCVPVMDNLFDRELFLGQDFLHSF